MLALWRVWALGHCMQGGNASARLSQRPFCSSSDQDECNGDVSVERYFLDTNLACRAGLSPPRYPTPHPNSNSNPIPPPFKQRRRDAEGAGNSHADPNLIFDTGVSAPVLESFDEETNEAIVVRFIASMGPTKFLPSSHPHTHPPSVPGFPIRNMLPSA